MMDYELITHRSYASSGDNQLTIMKFSKLLVESHWKFDSEFSGHMFVI